jgi:hypothetical protein
MNYMVFQLWGICVEKESQEWKNRGRDIKFPINNGLGLFI